MALHMDFVEIPEARFLLGSTYEQVEHCVTEWSSRLASVEYDRVSFRSWIMKEAPAFKTKIAKFHISRFPTTNADYREFVRATGAREPQSFTEGAAHERHPVWGVTYAEAVAFGAWLSNNWGIPLRLPTEPEWEYAARGVQRNEYPWGNEFLAHACNTLEGGVGHTTNVARYENFASPFGVCDLAGNVEEWTSTFYSPYPGGRWVEDDLSRLHAGTYRVMRGGSCARSGDLARTARRHGPFPDEPFKYKGFRLVADALARRKAT